MTSPTEIATSQLARLIGIPTSPSIIDVRDDDDFADDPRFIPGSYRRDYRTVAAWASECGPGPAIVVCQKGLKLSQGVAAWLRSSGIDAQSLEGGYLAWRAASQPLVKPDKLPPRDAAGRTVWVTRARPKVDRIACPWLIRRFIDPGAMFLFVAPSEVLAVAERFSATPFDIEGVFWSPCFIWRESFGVPTRRGRIWSPRLLVCWPRLSDIRVCSRMILCSSSMPWLSTMRSIGGAETPSRRRTIGRRPRGHHD
jgi:rhodanese-related sulfurtransferase